MKKRFGPPALIISIFILSAYSALFTVGQSEHAFVLQLGKPVGGLLGPGLHIKIPFIQKALKIDMRLLNCPLPDYELMTLDKQKIVASFYVKWQVAEPLEYYRRTGDKKAALRHLQDVIGSELGILFGKHRLRDILAKQRSYILQEATKHCQETCQEFGIDLIDLQIRNIYLTEGNREAVYSRMKTEFASMAQQYRSAGMESKSRLEAQVDRNKASILSESQLTARSIQGQAEAAAMRIYAEAFGNDPEFFNFTRTLEVSRKIMDEKSILFLSPDYEFLQFFKQSGVKLTGN
jgi:modulator of FtsH protease HflC